MSRLGSFTAARLYPSAFPSVTLVRRGGRKGRPHQYSIDSSNPDHSVLWFFINKRWVVTGPAASCHFLHQNRVPPAYQLDVLWFCSVWFSMRCSLQTSDPPPGARRPPVCVLSLTVVPFCFVQAQTDELLVVLVCLKNQINGSWLLPGIRSHQRRTLRFVCYPLGFRKCPKTVESRRHRPKRRFSHRDSFPC